MESKKRLNLSKIDKILKVKHNFVLHSIKLLVMIKHAVLKARLT